MRAQRHLLAAAALLAAGLVMTGCSSPADSPETSGTSTEVVAPVIVPIDDDLAGTTVSVDLDSAVDLTADDPEAWQGTVADESVAEFIPGGEQGSATFNPGLKPLSGGTTEVTLTDGSKTIEFTLEVKG